MHEQLGCFIKRSHTRGNSQIHFIKVYKQVWLSASEMEESKMMTECLLKYKRGFVAFSDNKEPEVQLILFLLGFLYAWVCFFLS